MIRPMRLTDTIKTDDDLKSQYKDSKNLAARSSIYQFAVRDEPWPRWVMDRWTDEIPRQAAVLEIGAGPGGVWKGQLDRVPRGWRILLTDLMPGMVAEAKASLGHDARFSFRQIHAEKLELPDESFDAVIANHMLYHVEDRPRALREISRVLKPGGKLLAATNSDQHLLRMQQLIGKYLGDASPLKGGMPFSLENGAKQIQPFFDDVQIKNLTNELRVTQADAVVRYVLSVEGAKQILVGEKLEQLRQHVQDEIDRVGAFVDRSHAGVFIVLK
jgi:ubiquinone/menaquinone biosynthesis C-methylase UbiE